MRLFLDAISCLLCYNLMVNSFTKNDRVENLVQLDGTIMSLVKVNYSFSICSSSLISKRVSRPVEGGERPPCIKIRYSDRISEWSPNRCFGVDDPSLSLSIKKYNLSKKGFRIMTHFRHCLTFSRNNFELNFSCRPAARMFNPPAVFYNACGHCCDLIIGRIWTCVLCDRSYDSCSSK